MQQSDWSYLIEKEEWVDSLYSKGNIQGKFVGNFHIHDQEPPTDTDLKASKKIREFIISNQGNKYTLYELMNGKINNKISREFRY